MLDVVLVWVSWFLMESVWIEVRQSVVAAEYWLV
jgi:hypothetical protein